MRLDEQLLEQALSALVASDAPIRESETFCLPSSSLAKCIPAAILDLMGVEYQQSLDPEAVYRMVLGKVAHRTIQSAIQQIIAEARAEVRFVDPAQCLAATVDLVIDNELYEIKVPKSPYKRIPDYWVLQCTTQALLAGTDCVYLIQVPRSGPGPSITPIPLSPLNVAIIRQRVSLALECVKRGELIPEALNVGPNAWMCPSCQYYPCGQYDWATILEEAAARLQDTHRLRPDAR